MHGKYENNFVHQMIGGATMRARAIFLAVVGVCVFSCNADAGGNSKARAQQIGCNQNVRAKVKAGTVKKVDSQSEYAKCMENSTTYQ